jgi:Icc-related predicted phosphoesterase
MRALCVADIHGDIEAVLKLRKSISGKGFEYVFLFGDYSRGFKDEGRNQTDVKRVLDILSDFKVMALPGNCDHKSALDIFNEWGVNLHNTVLNHPDASIIGFGGSNPTPFKTPFEVSEEEIMDGLNHLYGRVAEGAKVIVMTHFPPKDTKCDVIPGGAHVGSTALRAFIEGKKPDLVLCSHIHEAAGAQDEIGGTRILNLGRISEGRAYVLEVSDTVNVDFYTE